MKSSAVFPAVTTAVTTAVATIIAALIATIFTAFIAPAAHAVFKCTASGAVSYSDRPCSEAGQSGDQKLDIPARSMIQRAPTEDALERERAEISRLQKSREQRERQDQQIRDLHTRGAAVRARKCSTLALQLRWREEDLRDATLQAQQKARVRARRAAEKYKMECQ